MNKTPIPVDVELFPETKNRKYLNSQVKFDGVIICDTKNNPFFPIDGITIDTDKFEYPDYIEYFHALYPVTNKESMLPFHFYLELFQKDYIVLNTRPIYARFPFTSKQMIESLKSTRDSKDDIFDFLKNHEISNYVFIVIYGDSNIDFYLDKIYKKINDYIINPIFKYNREVGMVDKNIHLIKLGPYFKKDLFRVKVKKYI